MNPRWTKSERLHGLAEQRRQDFKTALDELASVVCPCGLHKFTKMSFCKPCYDSLPKQVRRGLYMPMRSGYVDAWREAHELLKSSERITNVR